MSALQVYKNLLSRKLSTSSTNFYDDDSRIQAINDALRQFTDEYQPIELRKKATITFALDADSNNIGSFPSDLSTHNRVHRLWDKSAHRKFIYIEPDKFYDLSSDVWTYDYNEANDAMRIYIAVTDITSLECHYTKDPALLSNDNDESGINAKADELIALYAAEKLFFDAKDVDGMALIRELKATTVRAWQGQYGMTSRRLKSKYEREFYHSRT